MFELEEETKEPATLMNLVFELGRGKSKWLIEF